VVTEPVVIAELQEELLVRERELSEWESALLARESGVVEGERDLRRAHMECDAIHDQVAYVQGNYLSRMRTFTADRRRSMVFDQVLSGRQFILSVQEADLKHREEGLIADQAWGFHPSVGRNLSFELGDL
jgi:hypothetical protein